MRCAGCAAAGVVILAAGLSLLAISAGLGDQSALQKAAAAALPDSGGSAIWATGRAAYIDDLTREARKWGLPPELADAVIHIESGYNPNALGSVGEVGLMQVRPPTAAMMGFKGTPAELAVPETNISLGVRYLAGAWRLAGGEVCRALTKYRAGHGEEWMSPLSADYCQRAISYLVAIGSPLAAQTSVSAFVSTTDPSGSEANASGQRPGLLARFSRAAPRFTALPAQFLPWYRPGGHLRTERDSRRFWAAHDARVRAISARIETRWRMRATRGA